MGGEAAAVTLHEMFADDESEAAAGLTPGAARGLLAASVEEGSQLVGRHAHAVVSDGDGDPCAILPRGDGDAALRVTELDGVREQVAQDGGDHVTIGVGAEIVRDVDGEADGLRFDGHMHERNLVLDYTAERKRDRGKGDAARLHTRPVEEVVE